MFRIFSVNTLNRVLLGSGLFILLLILIKITYEAGTFISSLAFLFSFVVVLIPGEKLSHPMWLSSRRTSWVTGALLLILLAIYLFLIFTTHFNLRVTHIETHDGGTDCTIRCSIIVEGNAVSHLKPGDRFAVYGAQARLVSGRWSQVPIALLSVVDVGPDIAVAQLLLVHEAAATDPGKRLQAGLKVALTGQINQSYLLPSYGDAYVIARNRIRLKPGSNARPGDVFIALEPQVQDRRILDILPGETRLQVVNVGKQGLVAGVTHISGPIPTQGTLLQLHAPGPSDIQHQMIPIPGASFILGHPQGEDDEKPLQKIAVKDFYISATEVTNAQFQRFIQDNGYHTPYLWTEQGNFWRQKKKAVQPLNWNDPLFSHPHQPVVGVTWHEAVAYANWFSGKTGKSYQLPTEAQWELACGGPSKRRYPWGDQWDGSRANYADSTYGSKFNHSWADDSGNDGYLYSAPVGRLSDGATTDNIMDMAGNAWEWTSSLYLPYPYHASDGRENIDDPRQRVIRGGGWGSRAQQCRCANRGHQPPDYAMTNIGFRLVRVENPNPPGPAR